MYILVKEEDVRNTQLRGMFHERMPDGRLVMPISELKMLGSVDNCQIVASAKELKELIRRGAGSIAHGDGVQGNGNVPNGGEDTGAGGNTGEAAGGTPVAGEVHTDATDNAVNAGTGNNTGETAGGAEEIADGQTGVTDAAGNINENKEE